MQQELVTQVSKLQERLKKSRFKIKKNKYDLAMQEIAIDNLRDIIYDVDQKKLQFKLEMVEEIKEQKLLKKELEKIDDETYEYE